MVVEDLQNIVSDAKVKFASRKALILVGGAIALVALTVVFMLLGLIYLGARNCSSGASMTAALTGGVTEDVCIEPLCLEAAAFVAKNRNISVNPCDDFYSYSCKGWQDSTAMPPEFGHTSILDHLALDNEQKWRTILESPVSSAESAASEKKVKDFFSHCMHDYGRNDDGQDLVAAIKTYLGGWYVLDPQNWSANWNSDNAVANAHVEFLVGIMFDFEIWPDPEAARKHIITILPEPQGMTPRDYTEPSRERLRTAYKTYIRTLGSLLIRDSNLTLTTSQTQERLDTFVDDVFEHERRLSQFKTEASSVSYSNEKTTLGTLARNFTQIHWVEILNRVFSHASITTSTTVQVSQAAYFRILDDTLRQEGDNMNRILNNYMVWRIAKEFTTVLSWEYRNARFDYIRARTGYSEFPNTWESCMWLTKSRLGLAMAALFVKKHVGLDTPKNVEKIVGDLRQASLKSVDELTWMDQQTKTIAKYKLANMDIMVGFPSVIGDQERFEAMYDQLKINKSESFFKNIIYTNEFMRYLVSHELEEDYKDNMWRYSVLHSGLGVRPMYYWFYNSMLVPPGALTFPLYADLLSKAMVFGGMGHFLGERMIHAVDSIGRHVVNGTFNLWWSENTQQGYDNATQCLGKHYKDIKAGPYLVDGEYKTVNVDGTPQMLRIVAKTFGLHIAYKGYMEQGINLKQQLLPGVNLTKEQLFFVSSAQLLCSKRRDTEAYYLASAGMMPDDVLVNGMVSQTPEFHKAFSCPATSKLKPSSFCKIF